MSCKGSCFKSVEFGLGTALPQVEPASLRWCLQILVIRILVSEMFGPQSAAQVGWKRAGWEPLDPIEEKGVDLDRPRLTFVEGCDQWDRHLAHFERDPVEIGAPDRGPLVVSYAHLGVRVDTNDSLWIEIGVVAP